MRLKLQAAPPPPPAWHQQRRSNGNTAPAPPQTSLHIYNQNRWCNTNRLYDSRLQDAPINNGTTTFSDFNVTNANDVNPTSEYTIYSPTEEQTALYNLSNTCGDEQVCNQQYRETLKQSINFENKQRKNGTLAANIVTQSEDSEVAFIDNQITPHDEDERMFEQSDTDEASESVNLRPVPRGIVNPNYPGFQHLAHTLQDYSKNFENFYHSENEMTDDDLDAEVIDLSYDVKDEEIFPYESYSGNRNLSNNNNEYENAETITQIHKENEHNYTNISEDEDEVRKLHVDVISHNNQNGIPLDEIPDLLKNVNTPVGFDNNNVYDSVTKESICLDTDIENNFSATNIIGDFNKEVEDEINNIFKHNLNFQDDLWELRKDIEVAFKKPIEDTINHISEVVNQVIKHLVVEHDEFHDLLKPNIIINLDKNLNQADTQLSEDSQVSKENESNFNKEMKQNRPTFLLLENNISSKTLDAFLSDAKDELQIYDADYEKVDPDSKSEVIENVTFDLLKCMPSLKDDQNKDTAPSASNNTTEKPVSIDDNFNEISGRLLKTIAVKPPEDLSQSTIFKKLENTPINVQNKEDLSQGAKEKDVDTTVKNESVSRTKTNYRLRRERRTSAGTSSSGARQRDKAQVKKSVQSKEISDDKLIGCFDVYNIETAMPKLDFDAIESHLKAAKEAERRKRNDREEIRRRLAMGTETEEYSIGHERPGRKPSLHSRLQSGMNLQICFMNETVSDNESQNSDSERSPVSRESSTSNTYMFNHPYKTRPLSTSILKNDKSAQGATAKMRPNSLSMKPSKSRSTQSLGHIPLKESDFYALQATLQTEARMALAQAKEMARIHMERERRCRTASPVTEMLRKSLDKANSPLAPDRRRVSRQLLTEMNVAQLQVIVNSLHGEVELLSESLVRLLMARDELHMSQDSMLVDIEDLTRYLGVKEGNKGNKGHGAAAKGGAGVGGVRRLASLVHK